MTNESNSERPRVIYGTDPADGTLIVVAASAISTLTAQAKKAAFLLEAPWSRIRDGLADLEPEVRALVGAELEDFLDDAWVNCRSADDPEIRLSGWFPGDDEFGMPFDCFDWLSVQARPTDPFDADLPDEIEQLGRYGASMISGDFITFSHDQLDELIMMAEPIGYEMVRDDSAAYGFGCGHGGDA